MARKITPLPKRASERKIEEAYRTLAVETKGRLDNTTEDGQQLIALLHDYCTAFANLYGEIIAEDAWDIIHDLEPELISKKKLLKKDFAAFTEILRLEQPESYYVFELDELYPIEERNPISRTIVHSDYINTKEKDLRYVDYKNLKDFKNEHPVSQKVLSKKETLSWKDPDRVYGYPDAKELKKFLKNLRISKNSKLKDTQGKPVKGRLLGDVVMWLARDKRYYDFHRAEGDPTEELERQNNFVHSEKLLRNLFKQIEEPYEGSIQDAKDYLLTDLEDSDVEMSQKQLLQLLTLLAAFNNNSRKRIYNGWTSQEMYDYLHPNSEYSCNNSVDIDGDDEYPNKMPETEEEMEAYLQEDMERTEKLMNVKATKGRVTTVPQSASDKEINAAYAELALKTKGRLDRAKPEGRKLIDRLHDYFAAMANLYGFFIPADAWDAIEDYEVDLVCSKKLRESDLYNFTDVLILEQPAGYYMFECKDIFPNASKKYGQKDRAVISDTLIDLHSEDNIFMPFDILLQQQNELDFEYAIPFQEELLEWIDPFYICTTPQAEKLKKFFGKLRVPGYCKKKDNDGIPVKNRSLDSFGYSFKNELGEFEKYSYRMRDDITVAEKLTNVFSLYIQSNSVSGVTMLYVLLDMIEGYLAELGIALSDKEGKQLIDRIHDINIQCRIRPLRGNRFSDVEPTEDFEGYEYTEDDDDSDDLEIINKIKESGLKILK